MTKAQKERYSQMKPLASQGVTNTCSIDIMEFEYGVEDYVIVRGYVNDFHRYKLKTSTTGRHYFNYQNGCRYYVDEFIVL